MNKREITDTPCCDYINQRFFSKENTNNQLATLFDKELKYEKKDIDKYINDLDEREIELIKTFLSMEESDLIEKLQNDDETVKDFFHFIKILFSENKAYWDKNYVLILERSICDKMDKSQDTKPEDLEFIKTIFNNNIQFFNQFFPEKYFKKVMNSNIFIKKHIIRTLINKKIITPFNIRQIQKILRWETFSFTSWTGKMRIETFYIKNKKEKQIISERSDNQVKFSKNGAIPAYSLHVTPGVEISKDSKNILSTIKKLTQLTPNIAPYVVLDSWLLDVDYENFCKKFKLPLKKELKENINNDTDIKELIEKMEANKDDPKKLKELAKKFKKRLSNICTKIEVTNNIQETQWNNISTRLNQIKNYIIHSTTYKIKDAEHFKESRFEKEKENIIHNNTAEARQHIKQHIDEWNISWLTTWIENLVIQEYLLQKYEEIFWLGHGRAIISLNEVEEPKVKEF